MLFLWYIMINSVLTKSSGPKSHAVLLTGRFSPVSVCVTRSGWGEQLSPHPRPTRPPTLISICTTHLSRQWEDLPTDLWAIQPACREVTDFKKAVSQRVKRIPKLIRNKLGEASEISNTVTSSGLPRTRKAQLNIWGLSFSDIYHCMNKDLFLELKQKQKCFWFHAFALCIKRIPKLIRNKLGGACEICI